MKTIISLCASLLLLATVGCKKTENVKTTSSDTTATVPTFAPMTDTTTSATSSPATPPATTTEPQKPSVKLGTPQTKSGATSPTAAKAVGSTTSKSTPLPAKTAPPATETKPSAAPAPTTTPTPSPAPAPSSNASLVSTGQSIFKSQCVSCHGADASGNTAMGRKNNIPDFRSSAVQGRSDADLANVIANGIKPLSASAHKSKHLSSDQVKALVAYVRSLK